MFLDRLKRTEEVIDFKSQKLEAKKRIEATEKQLADTKKKLTKYEQLNRELLEKITEERSTQHEEQTEPDHKVKFKGIIIGDSNSRRIAPHLQRPETWDITENSYAIADADKLRSDKPYDAAIYLLGTNDIKVGKDGKREAEHLLSIVEKAEIASKKFIVELPTTRRKGRERSAEYLTAPSTRKPRTKT